MTKKILQILLFLPLSVFAQDSTKVTAAPSDTVDIFLKSADVVLLEKRKTITQLPDNQRFMSEFEKKFPKDFDKETQYSKLVSANVDAWEIDLYDKRKAQTAFLKNYKEPISEDFKKLMETNIRYNYWHLLLAYAVLRSNFDTKATRLTSLPNVMLEGLDLKKVNDENALLSPAYRNFLPFFVTYFNSDEQKFQKYADQVKAVSDKANFAQKYLSGKVLDFTLTKLLYDNCGRLSPSSAKFWISQIYDANYSKLLKEHCAETLNKKEEIAKKKEEKPKDAASEYPLLTDLKGKKFSLESFKGKVVYVDFWASWCGPCRQQFPFSAEMHEKLSEKQKKKVVFLYISIDEQEENWKTAIEKLQIKGEHGHSVGGWDSEMARKFKISSIPRYMIIDPKGNIVLPDAPRPSNANTFEEIIKLIDVK